MSLFPHTQWTTNWRLGSGTLKNLKTLALPAAAIMAVGLLILYLLTGVQDAISHSVPMLKSLRNSWLLDGAPSAPTIEKYIGKGAGPSKFFVWTNQYSIGNQTYRSIFGMSHNRFEGKGILAISKEGDLIWVSATKPPKLLQ